NGSPTSLSLPSAFSECAEMTNLPIRAMGQSIASNPREKAVLRVGICGYWFLRCGRLQSTL
ncbi:MAG: hypothetical protein SGJ20_09345, partial [Planctomycetota bacterium]|nr:hypothetical protein [Planctomycetota bacterium]